MGWDRRAHRMTEAATKALLGVQDQEQINLCTHFQATVIKEFDAIQTSHRISDIILSLSSIGVPSVPKSMHFLSCLHQSSTTHSAASVGVEALLGGTTQR